MISLKSKKNTKTGKRELVEAKGLNSQQWRIYKPNQNKDFNISRSRFEDYRKCQRCFYLKTVKGFMEPGTPPWNLNTLTDTLLKKEFDVCREKQIPHRIMIANKLKHLVPYKTENIKDKKGNDKLLIDVWRDSRNAGLKHRYKNTNIILQGGVDDVWFNTKTEELIVADYKSTHKELKISQDTYFDFYTQSYKTQLDFYAYLLKGMGYKVSLDAYLYICNAKEVDEGFNGQMLFDETLILHKVKTDYIHKEVQQMIDVINSDKIPDSHTSCENCAYARQRSVIDKLKN